MTNGTSTSTSNEGVAESIGQPFTGAAGDGIWAFRVQMQEPTVLEMVVSIGGKQSKSTLNTGDVKALNAWLVTKLASMSKKPNAKASEGTKE